MQHDPWPQARPTVAIDLDFTLTVEPWSGHDHVGPPAPHSQRVVKRFVDAGWQVLIYTCRVHLHTVRVWAEEHYPGISGINCNPDDINAWGIATSKPNATIYIDDKAWPLRGGPVNWLVVESDMEERGIF